MAFRTNKMPVLQTKSASGSVATFNTALAMPLSSCNIAVNAWQEGSGDPSPDNVRPIHGFSEVNANVGSGNLYNGTFGGYNELSLKAGTQLIIQGEMSNDVYLVLRVYDENKTFLQSVTTATGTGTRYGVITLNSDISYYRIERSSQSGTYNNIMLSLGTTVKPYTPYVTPTIYTKALGETVYGGSYNSVTGKLTITHAIIDMGSLSYSYQSQFQRFYSTSLVNVIKKEGSGWITPPLCEILKPSNDTTKNYSIGLYDNGFLYLVDWDYTTVAALKSAFTGYKMAYELATPIEIQLDPTEIKTFNGSNNIFCDTGDIDLTYKDLDIAKRGNFREVFKLPS